MPKAAKKGLVIRQLVVAMLQDFCEVKTLFFTDSDSARLAIRRGGTPALQYLSAGPLSGVAYKSRAIRMAWLQETIGSVLERVPTGVNPSDIGTKPLSPAEFAYKEKLLGIMTMEDAERPRCQCLHCPHWHFDHARCYNPAEANGLCAACNAHSGKPCRCNCWVPSQDSKRKIDSTSHEQTSATQRGMCQGNASRLPFAHAYRPPTPPAEPEAEDHGMVADRVRPRDPTPDPPPPARAARRAPRTPPPGRAPGGDGGGRIGGAPGGAHALPLRAGRSPQDWRQDDLEQLTAAVGRLALDGQPATGASPNHKTGVGLTICQAFCYGKVDGGGTEWRRCQQHVAGAMLELGIPSCKPHHTKYFVKWNLDHFPTQEEYDRLEAADKQRQKNERQLAARLAKGKGKGK